MKHVPITGARRYVGSIRTQTLPAAGRAVTAVDQRVPILGP